MVRGRYGTGGSAAARPVKMRYARHNNKNSPPSLQPPPTTTPVTPPATPPATPDDDTYLVGRRRRSRWPRHVAEGAPVPAGPLASSSGPWHADIQAPVTRASAACARRRAANYRVSGGRPPPSAGTRCAPPTAGGGAAGAWELAAPAPPRNRR
jgi:hypothetical protein